MKKDDKRVLFVGNILIVAFAVWTALIQIVDVQPIGQGGTAVGFASFNSWFHKLTGVHMTIYTITDWLGRIPLFVCIIFGGMGFVQLVKRKSLFKVDYDIIFLGIYYVIVICGYLIFEMLPINYRPILMEGFLEASYPSSTTLLVLSVMPTLIFQVKRRAEGVAVKKSFPSSSIRTLPVGDSVPLRFFPIGILLSSFPDIRRCRLSVSVFLFYFLFELC